MIPGELGNNGIVGFDQDRFNNSNGAIFMNPGYFILPPGIYFNNSFSLLVWVKVLYSIAWARIIDCGNGQSSDNVAIVLSRSSPNDKIPYAQVFRDTVAQTRVFALNKRQINTWFHVAAVFDGQNLMIYMNGVLEGNSTSGAPLGVVRNSCYIGRSNWNVDPNAFASYDDLMIYNRALSSNEVQNFMNVFFY